MANQFAAWQGPMFHWQQEWIPYAYETSGPNAWKTYGWWLHKPSGKTYRKRQVPTNSGAWYWERFDAGPDITPGATDYGPHGEVGTWWIVCNALPTDRKWRCPIRGTVYPPVEPG